MTRRLRTSAALAAVVLTTLIAGGCGTNTAGTASTADGGSSRAPSSIRADTKAKAVKFAECVRGHGVGDFPDPDATGDFAYGVSVAPEVFTQAVEACKDLQPPGSLSSTRTPKQQSAALRFAACMRRNGVGDFPDPIKGEPLINTYRIPSSNRSGGMTILNATIATCRDVLDEAAAAR